MGRWSQLLRSELERSGDLRSVARLSSRQAAMLRAAGVGSVSELAAAHATARLSVPGMDDGVVARLQRQAWLQQESRRRGGVAMYEVLAGARVGGSALHRLPLPHPDDVFFDLEARC